MCFSTDSPPNVVEATLSARSDQYDLSRIDSPGRQRSKWMGWPWRPHCSSKYASAVCSSTRQVCYSRPNLAERIVSFCLCWKLPCKSSSFRWISYGLCVSIPGTAPEVFKAFRFIKIPWFIMIRRQAAAAKTWLQIRLQILWRSACCPSPASWTQPVSVSEVFGKSTTKVGKHTFAIS